MKHAKPPFTRIVITCQGCQVKSLVFDDRTDLWTCRVCRVTLNTQEALDRIRWDTTEGL